VIVAGMRRVVWTAFALAVVMLTSVAPAPAQFMRDHEAEGGVRGFHGPRSVGKITRSFQSDAEAEAEFKRILSAVGLGYVADRITLRATAQTPNAEAFIDDKTGERFIFYNATFMQRVQQRTAEDWSPISILAHEVGHHLAFHTVIVGNDHKFELEADYFSGFVLRRLGATLDHAQAAMRVISPKTPGPSHPGLDDRIQVITIGWKDGGASGAPPGLKDVKQSVAGAQTAAAEGARICREVEGMSSLSMLGVLANQHKGTAAGDCVATRLDELKRAEGAKQVAEAEKKRAHDVAKAETERQRLAMLKVEQGRKRTEAQPRPDRTFRDCPECPELVLVPAGSFMMGSPVSEAGRDVSEGPQRKVTIVKPFAVGKFEVTFAQWDACVAGGGCKHKPEDQGWGREKRPVINVSWDDITKDYLPWLSLKTGKVYRLLSEAEWEYAARAGSRRRWSFDGDEASELSRIPRRLVGLSQAASAAGSSRAA
jgi:hypothetical protein